MKLSPEQRFLASVARDESSACLLWTGYRGLHGYGQFKIGGRHMLAHRFAYAQARGEIPPGMVVHHRCGRKTCVHPLHLALLGRGEHARLHKPPSAVCVRCGGDEWYDRPSGKRECRTCNARRRRERYVRGRSLDAPPWHSEPCRRCGDTNWYERPDGWRSCRTCSRAYDRERRGRKRAARKAAAERRGASRA